MGDEAAAEQARRRLVRLGGPGAPAPAPTADGGSADHPGPPGGTGRPGWVPPDPTLDVGPGAGADLRRRAISAALVGYTAAHGHPLDHREPVLEGGVRWVPTRRQVVVAVVALVVLLCALALRTGATLPSTTVETGEAGAAGATAPTGPVGPAGPEPGAAASPPAPSPGVEPPTLVVHVVGEVAVPGVLTLPQGSRVADAVDAAGGALPTAELTTVNLARLLVDGEQVLVPGPGTALPGAAGAPGTGAQSGSPPAGLVDLNSADLTALDALPGIGPVLAQRVLDWRTEHGRFTSIEELTEVPGIGPSLLDGVRDLVRV